MNVTRRMGLEDGGALYNAATRLLYSGAHRGCGYLHKVNLAQLAAWMGGQCALQAPVLDEKLLALDGCCRRENHSLSRMLPLRVSCASGWAQVHAHMGRARRTQWIIEKERRKTKET